MSDINVTVVQEPAINVTISSGVVPVGVYDKNYIHHQDSVSALWTVNHGLLKFPSVTIVDSSGRVIISDVQHISNVQCVINFNAAFSGKVYCN